MESARHLILGTAGHIDHGKTSLVRRLTGIDTDRLPEEKRRGITIDLGFANMSLPGVELGIVDVPGHERFVHNMVAGAMPTWGTMSAAGWQKVINFATGAGIVKEAQAPSNKEGVLWTNKYVGKP